MLKSIELNFNGGQIGGCIMTANLAAEKFDCPVYFRFNGVLVRVCKEDDMTKKKADYLTLLEAQEYEKDFIKCK